MEALKPSFFSNFYENTSILMFICRCMCIQQKQSQQEGLNLLSIMIYSMWVNYRIFIYRNHIARLMETILVQGVHRCYPGGRHRWKVEKLGFSKEPLAITYIWWNSCERSNTKYNNPTKRTNASHYQGYLSSPNQLQRYCSPGEAFVSFGSYNNFKLNPIDFGDPYMDTSCRYDE